MALFKIIKKPKKEKSPISAPPPLPIHEVHGSAPQNYPNAPNSNLPPPPGNPNQPPYQSTAQTPLTPMPLPPQLNIPSKIANIPPPPQAKPISPINAPQQAQPVLHPTQPPGQINAKPALQPLPNPQNNPTTPAKSIPSLPPPNMGNAIHKQPKQLPSTPPNNQIRQQPHMGPAQPRPMHQGGLPPLHFPNQPQAKPLPRFQGSHHPTHQPIQSTHGHLPKFHVPEHTPKPVYHDFDIPIPPPSLRSEISPIELEKMEEKYLGKHPKIEALEEPYKYEPHKNLRRPLYVRTDQYRLMLDGIGDIKSNLKEEDEIIFRLENLKKNQDVEYANYKKTCEDIQRKLIYIDRIMFER